MIFHTSEPRTFTFSKIDVAERYSKPAFITAGDGDEPDMFKLTVTDLAPAGVWRAMIPDVVAKAERLKPPYVPPPEPPAPVIPDPVIATGKIIEDDNVPGAL